jgi:hypothetical protein
MALSQFCRRFLPFVFRSEKRTDAGEDTRGGGMERHERLQERLDALLSARPSARRQWSLPERDEVEPLLEIADELAHIHEVIPTPAFADELEARLLVRARRRATGGAGAENGAVVDALDNTANDAPTVPLLALPNRPGRRGTRSARDSRRVSWRIWSALAAAVLLALTITTFAVAAYASPGSALYGVRRWQEDARTNLANSDVERTQLHIQYATDALDALDTAVAQHDGTAYREALGRFTDELGQATAALEQVPTGSDHDALAARLDELRARGRSDLRAALSLLSWSLRIATTSALGTLGETVMTVRRVSGVRSGLYGARLWTLTITGSGFQSGAIVLVDGRPAGHVVAITPTRVVAQLAVGGQEDALTRSIGVGNPDGTAATSQVTEIHDDASPRPTGAPGGCGIEHEDYCTPTPMSTPTSTSTSTPTSTPTPQR